MNDDERDEIEQMVQKKGLTAPRLTIQDIKRKIISEQYYIFPGTTMTVCCLTLQNGYHVVGQSSCVSPENFDEEIGKKISKIDAEHQIWQLEGYLLKQDSYDSSYIIIDKRPI